MSSGISFYLIDKNNNKKNRLYSLVLNLLYYTAHP